MLTLIGIFLFLWGCVECAAADDYDRSEARKERRHRELLAEQRRHNELIEQKQKKHKKIKRTRRILRDENGKFIAAEEIIEEYEI